MGKEADILKVMQKDGIIKKLKNIKIIEVHNIKNM